MTKTALFIGISSLLAFSSISCSHQSITEDTKYVDYVNTKIGSGGHAHVFVGASVPYGMVQLGPTSMPQSWDWTSGYHESDSTVIGFSHTHISGCGVGDLYDITIMPVTTDVLYQRGLPKDSLTLWYADRSKEITKPGYYSVSIADSGINVELTATNRAGIHRYSFPATDSPAIIIDLQNGGYGREHTLDSSIQQTGENSISGHRHSTGWAKDQNIFFVAEFSEPIVSFSLNGENDMFGRIGFAPSDTPRQILVKVGISPTSIDDAAKNLKAETEGKTFEDIVEEATLAWGNELQKIQISTEDPEELQKFYTSMYHFMIHPSTFNNVGETPQYTILSLWDTYRAAMPLLTIIDPERSGEIVNSMLDINDQQGRLPVWHLWGNETDCMVGNSGVIIVADGVVKRLPGVDLERAMKAMIKTNDDTIRGLNFRKQYGYIPVDLKREAIAWDMEYAIADAAIANAAKSIGNQDLADEYTTRSHSYRNYFDPETKFMRGKDSKGEWRTPFNPSYSNVGNDYCEGNAWQYTWLVPQDIEGLRELFGGREEMIAHLDSLFVADPNLDGENVTPDISGLIGQYVHGNEPSHHITYIYSMEGNREKTAEIVTKIMDELYSTQTDGIAGNEDAGQMSAWYIFSALGFYPVEPAAARYWIGTPRYESARINLPGNKVFTVKKGEKGSDIILNGKPLDRNYITHDEIMNGGELIVP